MFLRILNISLASLVLFGSLGLPMSRHYCMGELKSVAYFGIAEKCHKEQTKKHCPFHPAPAKEDSEEGVKKKGCCDDEFELLQVDDQEQLTSDALPLLTNWVADYPPQLFSYLPPLLRLRKNTNFENYRPPPRLVDARRSFQVFRI